MKRSLPLLPFLILAGLLAWILLEDQDEAGGPPAGTMPLGARESGNLEASAGRPGEETGKDLAEETQAAPGRRSLTDRFRLLLRALLPDGRPAAAAGFLLEFDEETEFQKSGDGTWLLERLHLPVRVAALAGGFWSDPHSLGPDEGKESGELALRGGMAAARLTVLARDRSGSPAGPFEVRIRYLGAPKDFPKDAGILGKEIAELKGAGPGVAGRWEVADLYPGRYWISVSSPDFAPAAGRLELAPGEHGTFSLTLIPAGFVRGRIVSPDGEPVAGATIDPFSSSPTMIQEYRAPYEGQTTSRADGTFRSGPLHAGTYLLAIQTKGFPYFRTERELEIAEGRDTDAGEIRPPAGYTLKLRVTEDDRTTPVAGASVEYAPHQDSLTVMSSWRKTRPPRTDVQGKVSIPKLNAGPWDIRVQSDGHARKELEVGIGPELPEETIVALDEELTIAGVVRDRLHGTPVKGADVTAFPAGQDDMTMAFAAGNGNQRKPVVTAVDGTFRIGGLGPGSWILRVRHSAYAPLLSETVETAPGNPNRA